MSGRPAWTVAGQYVHDGYCYRIMRRPVRPPNDVPHLARREEEALALASDGLCNKQIAQVLGVSPSTVGVLLFRAAAKLHVRSRCDLVAAYGRLGPAGPALPRPVDPSSPAVRDGGGDER